MSVGGGGEGVKTGKIVLRAGPADLLRCRFAASPVNEVIHAVRAFTDPRTRPYMLPWWHRVKDMAPPPELLALVPRRGYTPDFLNPPSDTVSPALDEQLAEVRATPRALVARELGRCRDGHHDPRARLILDGLLADPAAARHRLADLLASTWEALVAPWWPGVREVLEADIAHRSRILGERGLGHVVDELHEYVAWRDETIVVRVPIPDAERTLDGRGFVLMPSAFNWPHLALVIDPPWQPTVIYPARGIGRLWRDPAVPPGALARLLGRTRALLLADLDQPASTALLAERHGLSASGVSAHLSALYEAGLLVKRRHRHEVRYERTALGAALAALADASGSESLERSLR